MSLHDVYLTSPMLAMAGLGILIVLTDLVIQRKAWLMPLTLLGLSAPLILGLVQLADLAGQVGGPPQNNLTPPESILYTSLSVDRLGIFFNLLVTGAAGLVILAMGGYVRCLGRLQGEFHGLMLLSASGMMLLSSATELITVYVALELTTLPLVALTAFLPNARSSEAGLKFLIIGGISSALTLYGMALIFGFTGSTNLGEIAASLQQSTGQPAGPFGSLAMLAAVTLVTVGIAFKLSAVPSQMWAPDVYEGGPLPVVAFLSVASKAVAFALLLRIVYVAFPQSAGQWSLLLAGLAAVSMTLGNLAAIAQSNIRRLLGYSTIAHAGYLLIGVAAVARNGGPAVVEPLSSLTTLGPGSVLFYLVAYGAANLTAFFAIMSIGQRIGSDRIADYAGVFRKAPLPALALTLAMVALIGIPPTGIFVAKIYIFTAAVQGGLTWLAVLGVVNSVISAYYYIRIVRVIFLTPPAQETAPQSDANRWDDSGAALISPPSAPDFAVLALTLTVILTLLTGIVPGPLFSWIEAVVSALPGVALK